jgi:hypothetical protein
MPVSKHKPTTSSPEGSTSESPSTTIPEQEELRQHLRRLAGSFVQVLIEQVMREELERCIGASWGECTPTRRGYRNGSYTRDLVTPTGLIEDLKVPRDRAGAFHTQVAGALYSLRTGGSGDPDRHVYQRHQYPSGGQSGGKTAGSGSQRQRRESPQPGSDRAI